jgi:hypothetical protein
LLDLGEIRKDDLKNELGNPDDFEDLWKYFVSVDRVRGEIVTLKKKDIKLLPLSLVQHQNKLYAIAARLWSAKRVAIGVGNAAVVGATIAGITSAAIATKNEVKPN